MERKKQGEKTMGLINKSITYETSTDDDFKIGEKIEIVTTKEQGTIIMKIQNLYQVQKNDGTIRSYVKKELIKSN